MLISSLFLSFSLSPSHPLLSLSLTHTHTHFQNEYTLQTFERDKPLPSSPSAAHQIQGGGRTLRWAAASLGSCLAAVRVDAAGAGNGGAACGKPHSACGTAAAALSSGPSTRPYL
jgi:hypothetical protein